MEALEIKTVFALNIAGLSLPITETVVISWLVMLILILGSLALTSRIQTIPKGPQAILEIAVEFLNNFAKNQFGSFAKHLGPYMGTLFLFIFVGSIIGVFSPMHISAFGREFAPPFMIRPPTKDINVTAALALISILLVLICGFAARGFRGWCKNLLHPVPFMLPFNLMEYGSRLISLALRLFGNILGGFVMMNLIEGLFPLVLPMIMSLYFDFFDGMIQALIFVFLTSLYISEAANVHE
jgi:F-type H+-transporting ATPase subunit a